MKLFKIGTILQFISCLLCLIVVCMPLYAGFYATDFGKICFKIGEVCTFISAFNPMGLIGTIIDILAYRTTDLKKSKKALAWVIVSPILITLLWIAAICLFVYNSGGV